MTEKIAQAKAMRAAGAKYGEIGAALGVTRARAHQLVKAREETGSYFHKEVVADIPYNGLREWMEANVVNVAELSRRCEKKRIFSNGYGINKSTVDKILAVTGLSYEDCFREG